MKTLIHVTVAMSLMIVLSGCGSDKNTAEKAPVRVKIEKVSSNYESRSTSYVGIVEEREATAVSFSSIGTVKRVYVEEGQSVARGQLIAVIDDTQARNMLAAAEANAAQADDAIQRYGMLHDNGSLPEVQWVEVQSKAAQAKAQLEVARKNLADCRLVSPVAGVVGHKFISAGETAMPSQAVVNILDISTVKVKVSIPETEYSGITPGTPSHIRVEALNRSYSGGHIDKGVAADALTHTYDVRIAIGNGDRKLLPGMVASVSFSPNSASGTRQVMTLPITAVQKAEDGTYFVWTVATDGTAHRSAVTTDETLGNRIIITEGIADGQCVVTEGYQKLSEGTRVVF